ncbi:hypothetical protein Taro_009612, partial [Colocasia esculenta]|nr:hypothetical protein [Colocasia esculenta]
MLYQISTSSLKVEERDLEEISERWGIAVKDHKNFIIIRITIIVVNVTKCLMLTDVLIKLLDACFMPALLGSMRPSFPSSSYAAMLVTSIIAVPTFGGLPGVSSQEDCAIKIRNLESKLDSIVCTIKDRKELERHVPMPLEVVVHYDKAGSLCFLHDQIKRLEVEVEEAANSSSRRSKWQFMGARDAGSKEELRFIYGVSERTESDGAANLTQKLRAINYALGELGQWCAFKVARSFLSALQCDQRANYQLDIKFQESYLKKVVDLLRCQLCEEKGNCDVQIVEEIEEGELPDSHG